MSELLNLVGLGMGVALYAMLLAMVLRGGGTAAAPVRVDPLLLVTGVLGLVWNLSALVVYELPKIGVDGPFPFLTAIGLGSLGFLPAVVVHSVLRGEADGIEGAVRHWLVAVAYFVSAAAAAMQLALAITGHEVPSALGMQLLTYTFMGLAVPLAVVTRSQPGSRRALWAAALSIFAVSALHLSQLHKGDASWPVELLGHHASVPLALAILYQDYPFALADLFLKRALALLAIVALAFGAIATFGAQSDAFGRFINVDPRQVGLLVTLWVATALLYPVVRRTTIWFVDRIVLTRPDYRAVRFDLIRRIQAYDDVHALLADLADTLAPALSATHVVWRETALGGDASALIRVTSRQTSIVIPAAEAPRYALDVTGLTGGRRLLSDDVAMLEAIAVAAARRIDAIRVTKERYDRQAREQEMARLTTEAELRALRAQVNPHFLFNALTTIGYLIQSAPPRALQTLLRLTALLRAVLRSEGEFTTLGRELDLIEAYLDIERARFENRLTATIDVPAHLKRVRVPPLILQPLVENAVKHGIAAKVDGGTVTVRAALDENNAEGRRIGIVIADTGAGVSAAVLEQGRARGVGLRNVERRLHNQYGDAASLTITSEVDRGTTVALSLPITVPASSGVDQVAV